MQIDMLKKMSLKQITNPSEKQSKILYDICMTANKEGIDLT